MKNHLACTLNSSFTPADKPLSRPSVYLAELAEWCARVRPLLEGSALQASTRGLGLPTQLVGLSDLPFCSGVTLGQFLDLSESQVPHL